MAFQKIYQSEWRSSMASHNWAEPQWVETTLQGAWPIETATAWSRVSVEGKCEGIKWTSCVMAAGEGQLTLHSRLISLSNFSGPNYKKTWPRRHVQSRFPVFGHLKWFFPPVLCLFFSQSHWFWWLAACENHCVALLVWPQLHHLRHFVLWGVGQRVRW